MAGIDEQSIPLKQKSIVCLEDRVLNMLIIKILIF